MALENFDAVIERWFFFSSRRRHTRFDCDWSSDVCSSDLNHPLDCPICDQAGECELQDFVFQEGRPGTRYAEYSKRFNPVEDFGPDVLYVPNRCILCTRCVRFMEDVAGEPVINVSERGGRAYIGIHPNARLDHPWAGNVVDLCPVGSLLSKDFLHRARAWELDKTASICTGCSQGCNITL